MHAKPILSLTLLAAALALPGTAASLGLGRLTLQSSLGQPLSAQIELTSVAKEELDSVTARVADANLYRQNNLAFQGVLSRARVAVERLPNGDAVLKVTTSSSVTEPYLDLLVEISWASGRVVRAYTFLLDPPGTPAAAATAEPITPARVGAAAARPAPAASTSTSRSSGESRGGATSYSVRRGDTLSKIAADYKPDSATLEQMLVALFAANANAFDGNNMNRLRAGAILTIPSAEQVTGASADAATKTVRMQAADWRSYQDRVAGSAPPATGAGSRTAGGSIGTTAEEAVPATAAGRDQLRVSREAAQGKGALPSSAAEEAVARDKALKDAQARIADLEKTLKDLQRAIDLKGQTTPPPTIAQADTTKGKAPEPPKTEAPKSGIPVAPPVAEPPKAAAPLASSPTTTEAPKAPSSPTEPPKAAAPTTPPATEAPKTPPAPAPKSTAPKVEPTKAPIKETSFIDDLVSNTPVWLIGGGALAVLGGIAALIAARRRKSVKFEDSIIGGSEIKTNTVFGSTGGGVVNTGENSLATDFSREGLGNIDTDEVDPIAEAEVYLAYGRDAQAEEILKDALKKDNQRQEIYLKLLEIHAQHNKPSAFETVAAELYSVSKGQGETWQKAVALGRQVDPNNPMFGEGGAGPAPSVVPLVASAIPEKPAEPPRPSAAAASRAPAKGGDDDALDFRFDEDVSISRTKHTTKEQIDKIDAAEREFEESAKRTAATAKASTENLATAAKAAGAAGVAAAAGLAAKSVSGGEPSKPALPPFDFEMEDDQTMPHKRAASLEPAEKESAAHAAPRSPGASDLEKLDLSFDSEHATFEDPTPSVLSGQWHDAATKLDLAKAYQEMGDVEGAREILQEVLHEGDEQQKTEAQTLLTKLG